MFTPSRTLAAAAILAALAGPASAQLPPDAAPLGAGTAYVGQQPQYQPGPSMPPMMAGNALPYEGPALATDSIPPAPPIFLL